MSKRTYEEYIKNGCHPVGYNEPCQSYYFGQVSVDFLLDQIDQLKQQLDQANERLRGAIIPKFKSEDIAYRISFFTKKVEKVAIIRTHIDTGRSCEIYYTIAILEDEQTFNDITPYFNISQEPEDKLFATKAEAEKRLQEELGH